MLTLLDDGFTSAKCVPSGQARCSALALNSNRFDMTSSSPAPEHRPAPTVAIVGNDAVLQAAPATPVQLAHACLRRGFAVAVPASWGDELVAAETVRRLAGRAQGPSVMCVCPFVRSRLLAPGPDLAPFLVALVAPPVAVARYLRAVYGDLGVHITYIGSCPSADDAVIDASLTPDDFFADIAEQGIALSEQPLVFDSIVPPDRRRWSSLPGGVPSPDVLWNEADGRTLIEIDPGDVSTDLAQHIITREHVLLDVAPSLGCVCSGAIASVKARSARAAVTTLEPPRAFGPVIDPQNAVVLDAPVGAPPILSRAGVPDSIPNVELAPTPAHRGLGPEILDLVIGTSVESDPAELEPAFDISPVQRTNGAVVGRSMLQLDVPPATPPVGSAGDVVRADLAVGASLTSVTGHGKSAVETLVKTPLDSIGDEPEVTFDRAEQTPDVVREETQSPRRRTPVASPVRHLSATIPRTAAPDGRLLPRAYVAKRRTPPAGMAALASAPSRQTDPEPEAPASTGGESASVLRSSDLDRPSDAPSPTHHAAAIAASPGDRPAASPSLAATTTPSAAASRERPAPPSAAPRTAREESPAGNARRSSAATEATRRGPGVLGFLLVAALIALATFVLTTLQR